MVQKSEVSVQLFASGYCEAHAFLINKKDGFDKTKFYAVWALFKIPNIGYVLFDSGYSEYFQSATAHYPERFYRWTTPFFLKEAGDAKSILEKQNIQPEEIKYIIVSHFHADHIAGVKDFPSAQFICSKAALDEVHDLKGLQAVRKGIIHKLLPDDFANRVLILEEFADKISINKYGMTEFELFGIQSFSLVLLPGHARGMLGFIYKQENQILFFGTDASWSYETYSKGILPLKIVNLFFDSWSDFIATQEKITSFEKDTKNSLVLFTHCKKTLEYIINQI